MRGAASRKDREFPFSKREFDTIRSLVKSRTGIHLSEAKMDMVYGRLVRRLRQLGLTSFESYLSQVETDDDELTEFINAITTNLTYFFRQEEQFNFLAEKHLPALMKANAQSRKLRIWSAGCSTGEEPYTLSMVIDEVMGRQPGWDVRILATDLDSNVLEKGRQGVYDEDRIKSLSKARRQRFFQRGSGPFAGKVRAKQALKDRITFAQLNLMDEPWPFRGPFDAIFCRNVVIYFDLPTKERLFERYASLLAPQGALYLGYSESLVRGRTPFSLITQGVYRPSS